MRAALKEAQYEDVVVTQVITKYNRRKIAILNKLKGYIQNKPEYRTLLAAVDNILKQISITESKYGRFYSLEEGWVDDIKNKVGQLHTDWKDKNVADFSNSLTKEWKSATQEILDKLGIKDNPEQAVDKLKKNGYQPNVVLTNNGVQGLINFYKDYDDIIDHITKLKNVTPPAPVTPTVAQPNKPSGPISQEDALKMGKYLKSNLDRLVKTKNDNLKVIFGMLPSDLQKALNRFTIDAKTPRIVLPKSMATLSPDEKEKITRNLNSLINTSYAPIINVLRNTAQALNIDINGKKVNDIVKYIKSAVSKLPGKTDYHDIVSLLNLVLKNLNRIKLLNKQILDSKPEETMDFAI